MLGTVGDGEGHGSASPAKAKRGTPDKSKPGKSQPIVELSLRKSHLHGVGAVDDAVVESIADVKPDSVLRGCVMSALVIPMLCKRTMKDSEREVGNCVGAWADERSDEECHDVHVQYS